MATGALLVAACGDDASSAGRDGGGGDSDDYRVAVLFIGTTTDGSFSQALYEGGENTAEKLGATVEYVGNLLTPAQYLSQGSSFADAGFDVVLLGHGAMGPTAIELADQFPDTTFCVPNAAPTDASEIPDNACFFYPAGEVGAFRAGMLSSLVTESDVVGAIQGLDFPGVNAQTQAFALGARCANPEVEVLNTLVSSDTDPAVTKAAAEAQITEGADVVLGTTSAFGGLFQAAAEHPGSYAIGQYVDASEMAPDAVLASSIVNLQEIVPDVVRRAQEGSLQRTSAYGQDSDVPVGLLELNPQVTDGIPDDLLARNDDLQAQVTAGDIRVPSFDEIGAIGSADTIDIASLGCEEGTDR